MAWTKDIWIGVYILLGLYLIYRIFLKRNPYQKEYERMYNQILNSDKYKVKGQYDKEE